MAIESHFIPETVREGSQKKSAKLLAAGAFAASLVAVSGSEELFRVLEKGLWFAAAGIGGAVGTRYWINHMFDSYLQGARERDAAIERMFQERMSPRAHSEIPSSPEA